jgi:DNA mismatch repair protein MutS
LKKLEAKEGGAKRLEELPLFANFVAEQPDAAAPSEADQMLAGLDPDTLTPKEALELVYRLKAATKG